ncbi:MAG: histidinol-phosphate transaminase [Gammaproteobacteria bacterium]
MKRCAEQAAGAKDPARIDDWVRLEVREIAAYTVPESHGYIKLDAMENPYSWPDHLVGAWLDVVRHVRLNRYPDGDARALKELLAIYLDLPSELDLLLGNGSDELIQMIGLTVGGPGRCLLAPEPTFAMYRMIAKITGLEYVGVPLRSPNFDLDGAAMLNAIQARQPAVVALSYPNNPTGNLFDRALIEEIIAVSPGLVLIDEAYFSFAGATWLDELSRHPRVLLLRTLSKIGLAGLRIGMLIGAPNWLAEINKTRLPYNINSLSQASGAFMLAHAAVFTAQVAQICSERQALYHALAAMRGLQVWPSRTNFLLLRIPGRADRVFNGLRQENILVKNLNEQHPLLMDCLRVTVGRQEENQAFCAALTMHLCE